MPYMCCIFNTVIVVACVIFIPGFSPCRRYWVWVFVVYLLCVYMLGWLCRVTCYFVSTFQCLAYHLLSKWKVEKRQLWVRPFEWLKLNFASCVVYVWTLPMGPERGRSTIDRGCELEAGSSGLYCLERAPYEDTACMSPTGRRGSQGHKSGVRCRAQPG